MLVFSWFVYGIGVSVTCRQSAHLLNVILGMEFIALGVYCVASVIPALNMLPIYMLLMTFSVGEVAIMLSLLVVMARAHGNDRCSSLMVDKC